MTKKGLQKEIDRAIKQIWINEICSEYGAGQFILERSIQCSLYHHLRTRLDAVLEENSLYLYPEFYFPELGYYADLAICQMDMDAKGRLSQRMTDVFAIVELKYGGSTDYIRSDLPKFRTYMQTLDYDCQYYFGVIDERAGRDRLNLLDGRSTGKWASGRFTELNAGWLEDGMFFEINSYNGMNIQHKIRQCEVIW